MTSIFLSYDRDDAAKARSIAAALEKAGHSVWWDRHIKGGSRYAAEIEKALSEADAVVVLWSSNSVQSDWVRDEAAKGRDSGRLVPARIDGVEPPLGFGQHHTTDLSKWRGRTTAPQFRALLDAIDGLGGEQEAVRRTRPSRPVFARLKRLIPIAVLGVLLIIGLILWRPWERSTDVPVVAVAPANDGPAAQALASDLLTQLGSLQAANADALELIGPDSDASPDLTFKIGGSPGSGGSMANLTLVDGRYGALLWSREFRPPSGKAADLRQQVAYTAARVLACSSEALAAELERQTLKLYLNGCAELHSLWEGDPRNLIDVFAKVTQLAPKFEGGWEKLLLAQLEVQQNSQLSNARQTLRRSIADARKVNPDMAEAYLAEAWTQDPRPIITWMRLAEKAVERNPNNPIALVERARGYQHVGRMRDAIEDTRRAVQVDPLSPGARDALASALAYSGQIDAGFKVLEEAERLWPGASNLVAARYRLLLRFGDPKQALQILRSGAMTAPATPMQESFLDARISPSPASIERAVRHARSFYYDNPRGLGNYIQALAQFGRDDELIDTLLQSDPRQAPDVIELMFRPAFRNLQRNPRFMAIAKRYGLVDYWTENGTWPDLCLAADLTYDCKVEAAKLR